MGNDEVAPVTFLLQFVEEFLQHSPGEVVIIISHAGRPKAFARDKEVCPPVHGSIDDSILVGASRNADEVFVRVFHAVVKLIIPQGIRTGLVRIRPPRLLTYAYILTVGRIELAIVIPIVIPSGVQQAVLGRLSPGPSLLGCVVPRIDADKRHRPVERCAGQIHLDVPRISHPDTAVSQAIGLGREADAISPSQGKRADAIVESRPGKIVFGRRVVFVVGCAGPFVALIDHEGIKRVAMGHDYSTVTIDFHQAIRAIDGCRAIHLDVGEPRTDDRTGFHARQDERGIAIGDIDASRGGERCCPGNLIINGGGNVHRVSHLRRGRRAVLLIRHHFSRHITLRQQLNVGHTIPLVDAIGRCREGEGHVFGRACHRDGDVPPFPSTTLIAISIRVGR